MSSITDRAIAVVRISHTEGVTIDLDWAHRLAYVHASNVIEGARFDGPLDDAGAEMMFQRAVGELAAFGEIGSARVAAWRSGGTAKWSPIDAPRATFTAEEFGKILVVCALAAALLGEQHRAAQGATR